MNAEDWVEWYDSLSEFPECDGDKWYICKITAADDIIRFLLAECQKWQEWHDCEYRERKKYRQDANHFAGEVQRLTAELKEREGECERLRVQLAGCGVAAMCNTERSREQQKCVEGDYGWSQSYQDVVNAVGREIELRDKLQAAESLAASRLADQDAIERHTEKRVARECSRIASQCRSGYGAAHFIREKYGVE